MKVVLKKDIVKIETSRRETVFYITKKNGNKEIYVYPNSFRKEIINLKNKLGVK